MEGNHPRPRLYGQVFLFTFRRESWNESNQLQRLTYIQLSSMNGEQSLNIDAGGAANGRLYLDAGSKSHVTKDT